MALSKTITTETGITVNDAYHKVTSVSLLGKVILDFEVKAYVSAEKTSVYSRGFSCSYDIAGENPIKQAYEHLKTFPEFADAKDV